MSLTDAVRIGDHMQSEASRMAEWILSQSAWDSIPYEVAMAAHGAQRAVEEWTTMRRKGVAG
jgi:hypothetical protein